MAHQTTAFHLDDKQFWSKRPGDASDADGEWIDDGSLALGEFYADCDLPTTRMILNAPPALAALRKAQAALRELEAPAHLPGAAELDAEISAILARIDGAPQGEAA